MCIDSNLLLLLKASIEDLDCPYYKAVSCLGLDVVSLSPVSFDWTNLSTLSDKLSHPDLYSGLVLTSQRSVQAIEESLKPGKDGRLILKHWQKKMVFVVGPATSRAAEQSLGMLGIGMESGSAEALAKVIIETITGHPERHKSLLFPCSSVKRETLPTILHDNDIPLDVLECYRTKPHPEIQEMFLHLVKSKGIPLYFVFFSPSGVKAVLPVLTHAQIPLKSVKFISMGASTTSCLSGQGLPVAAEAPSPDPPGLVAALRTIGTGQR